MRARAARDELMDAPDCDETRLLRTIRQFSSINRLVSRYRTILKREVLADMRKDPDREYHLVDMGAGGCDIDAWLLKTARRLGLKLRISACDLDPRIIEYARAAYGSTPGLDIRRRDLLAHPPEESVDYVFANHFLHHLKEEQIGHLLRMWAPRTRRRMVLSDLRRSPPAYLGFSVLSLFYPDSFTRTDGLISISKGFLPGELQELAGNDFPQGQFAVRQYRPGRLVLCIECSALPNAERTVNSRRFN